MRGRTFVLLVFGVLGALALGDYLASNDVEKQEEPAQQDEATALDALVAAATTATPDSGLAKMAAAIEARGMWCGTLQRLLRDPFKSTANLDVYHAHCAADGKAINYELVFTTAGAFVSIEEK